MKIPIFAFSCSLLLALSLPAEGGLPVLTEPVHARIRVPVPGTARVYVLDSTGKRGRLLDPKAQAGAVEIDPADAASIWCEIVSP